MKRLLKYLLPVIMAAAFWNCADGDPTHDSEASAADMAMDEIVSQAGVSSAENEFYLPRPTNFTTAHRVQTAVRRTNGAQRTNIEFTKYGKVINVGLIYCIQKNTLLIHSTLIEPSNRLLYLGKLII